MVCDPTASGFETAGGSVAIAAVARSAITRHGGDHAACQRHLADAIVAAIRDVEIAHVVQHHCRRIVQFRISGGTIIPAKTGRGAMVLVHLWVTGNCRILTALLL
jgi:hypothetical protein